MRLIRTDTEHTRWLELFPDEFPGFKVEAKRLARQEMIRIADRHGIASKKATLERGSEVEREIMLRSIVAWAGESAFFKSLDPGVNGNTPCDNSNKQRFLLDLCEIEHQVDGDTVRESLWSYITRRLTDEEAVELKN